MARYGKERAPCDTEDEAVDRRPHSMHVLPYLQCHLQLIPGHACPYRIGFKTVYCMCKRHLPNGMSVLPHLQCHLRLIPGHASPSRIGFKRSTACARSMYQMACILSYISSATCDSFLAMPIHSALASNRVYRMCKSHKSASELGLDSLDDWPQVMSAQQKRPLLIQVHVTVSKPSKVLTVCLSDISLTNQASPHTSARDSLQNKQSRLGRQADARSHAV